MYGEGGTLGPFTKTEQLACFTHPPRQSAARPARSQRRPSAPAAAPGRCPWYWQRSAGTGWKGTPGELWSSLLYCIVWHPRLLLLLSGLLWASVSGAGTRVAGRVAAGALATLCSAQAPTADTAQRNQLLGTRPVPSAWPRPTCCLSWADPPGSPRLPSAMGKSGRKLFLGVRGSLSLPFNLCVTLRESIPLKFHYLLNMCLKWFSRESPAFEKLVFGPDLEL